MSDQMASIKHINSQKHKKGNKFHKIYKENSKTGSTELNNSKCSAIRHISSLPSNWDKYDRPLNEELESSSLMGIDFNALSLMPSPSSHFQLKQDKVFLPNSNSSLDIGDFFKLDLNLVNLSLATIPFYQRIGIDKELLTEEELKYMNQNALEANSLYQIHLAKKSRAEPTESEEEISTCNEIELKTDNLEEDNGSCCSKYSASKNKDEQDLEKWLNTLI